MVFHQLGEIFIFVDMRVVVDITSSIELSGLLVELAVVSHLLMFCNCMHKSVTEMRTLISYRRFQLANLPEALRSDRKTCVGLKDYPLEVEYD
jgi:hypothetical protein